MTAILILTSIALGIILAVIGLLLLADLLDKLPGVSNAGSRRLVLREPEPVKLPSLRQIVSKPKPFQVVPVKAKPSVSELEVEALKAEVLFLREQIERKNIYR